MKVKVCGITGVDQLKALQDLGADYAGLIFYPQSKRFAGEKLGPVQAEVRATSIKKVGVFVNELLPTVLGYIKDFGLHAVQLHGDEDPAFCQSLMDFAVVIKVFRLRAEEDVDALVAPFLHCCHFFLFDTDGRGYGGTGRKFNWQVLQQAAIGKPFFLSGGVGPDDVAGIKALQHPLLEAVDINSSFETAPGIKNLEDVSRFISAIRSVS